MSKKADPLAELEVVDDAPKKADKRAPRRTRKRSGKGATYSQIQEGLDSFVSMVGVGVQLAGDEYCGNRIITAGPELSSALVELSKQNPNVKRMLSSLSQSSAWGGVIIAAAAVALPIMAHHGLVPGQIAALMGAPLEGLELEAGGARDLDRPDGPRQDNASPGHTPTPDLLTSSSV